MSTTNDEINKERTKTNFYSLYSHDIDRFKLLTSDIPEEQEIELRTCLSQRIGKTSASSASGSIINLHFSNFPDANGENAMSYFYKILVKDRDKDPADENPLAYESQPRHKEFVICFIGQKHDNLDLFRHEFDDFCSTLDQKYDGQGFDEVYINSWYEKCVDYLSLVVNTFQHSLKHLLYLALVGHKFTISGASPQLSKAITQFIDSCSLSELLQPESMGASGCTSESSSLVDLGNEDQSADVQASLVVTVTDGAIIVDDKYVTQFCEDWCAALIDKVEMGPICLKQIINSYKLKCIHDVNELNRLIRLAENDHYALYRTYLFLKGCLNARVLLLYADQESRITKSTESQSVLRVLSEYMSQTDSVEQ